MKLAEIAKKALLKEYDTQALQQKYPNMRPERMIKIVNFLKKRKLENGILFAPLDNEEELFAMVVNEKTTKLRISTKRFDDSLMLRMDAESATIVVSIEGVVSVPFLKRPDSEKQWMYHGDPFIFALQVDLNISGNEIYMKINKVIMDIGSKVDGVKGSYTIYPLNKKEEVKFMRGVQEVLKNYKYKIFSENQGERRFVRGHVSSVKTVPNIFSKSQM